jgi:hypothetical protein
MPLGVIGYGAIVMTCEPPYGSKLPSARQGLPNRTCGRSLHVSESGLKLLTELQSPPPGQGMRRASRTNLPSGRCLTAPLRLMPARTQIVVGRLSCLSAAS